jgi:hypothetical protein
VEGVREREREKERERERERECSPSWGKVVAAFVMTEEGLNID